MPNEVDFGLLKSQKYSVRVEAFVNEIGDNGSLDLIIGTETKKYKPQRNIVVANTIIDASSSGTTTMEITVSYITGKEIAVFLYGVPGEQYVNPFVVDNFPKLALDGSTTMTGDLDVGNQKVKKRS